MDVVVLGAGGGSGQAITAELAARGHAVAAVTRRGDASAPEGVRSAAADLYDADATRQACAGAEVVVLAAMPPYDAWGGNFERMIASVTDAVAAAGARLVLVDNLYMYAPADGPISERSPEHATGKGALRREIARRVLDDGRFPSVVGRASDYYGPGGTNSFLHGMVFEPALAGKPVRILLDGDQPHTWHYLRDMARGLAALVEHPDADGRAWILPAAPPLTQRQVVAIVRDLVVPPVRVRRISAPLLTVAAAVSRSAREGRKVAQQFDRPWVVDASAFEAAFGQIGLTEHPQAVAETLDWLRGQAPGSRPPERPRG